MVVFAALACSGRVSVREFNSRFVLFHVKDRYLTKYHVLFHLGFHEAF